MKNIAKIPLLFVFMVAQPIYAGVSKEKCAYSKQGDHISDGSRRILARLGEKKKSKSKKGKKKKHTGKGSR